MINIKSAFKEIEQEIIGIRRKIHSYPEIDFDLENTAKIICGFLDKHGISHTDKIAKCGIMAQIGDAKKGKNVLIRADMDALEIEEKTGLEYSSQRKGLMHACGHDFHIANALAAAYILKKNEAELGGCVKIVFQPAEETNGGAKPMIDEGILENPHIDFCIGAHVSAMHPTREIYITPGPLMASPDDFELVFKGKSTHGAQPQDGINPIPAASEFVLKIHEALEEKISFESNVFSICTINSGFSRNIIPDEAKVSGTFRSFSTEDREIADKVIDALADELCKKYGCKYEYAYNYLFPPLINNKEFSFVAKKCAGKVVGERNVKEFEKPLMTGEDFSYFALERPSVFAWVGCAPEGRKIPLHSSEFQADESVTGIVAEYFCEICEEIWQNS